MPEEKRNAVVVEPTPELEALLAREIEEYFVVKVSRVRSRVQVVREWRDVGSEDAPNYTYVYGPSVHAETVELLDARLISLDLRAVIRSLYGPIGDARS